jgi:hypothetical protein
MSADLRRLSELDRLIHEPARYIAILSAVESADFLYQRNGADRGNLSPT